MARDKANEIDVLEALRVNVRDKLALNDSTCYITDDPLNIEIPKGGEYWVSVAPGSGSFDEGLMADAILEQCMMDTTVQLTGYTRIYLDRADHARESFLAQTRGMLWMKKELIKTIAEVDLVIDDEPFLRNLLRPTFFQYRRLQVDSTTGRDDAGLPINAVIIDVAVAFDLDLD